MSKKRIICSDDEESDEEVQFVEFSGVDKVSSGEMPLPAEELSGINSCNILDSETLLGRNLFDCVPGRPLR